ncbi:RagB/SusD family nutrient uptake outer membrane protein [Parabacteroides sp. PF5-9]|uniref:RagB/SusD family nutrient uptake outer membrane protein n=1 Tax=Parabacteroides sp. PF5-9 TaxID=1742404 RepID=UPI002476D27D|nr:RagB/SusD family nutrient uptake outer membrane protein [Parabacteroides sp. PF5-9]MDH6358723.1 hypothetical protein [Parabacteroides sp. PF5-9]
MIRNIKKYKWLLMSIMFLTLSSSCNDFLDVESLTKMDSDRLLSSEKGLKTLLANMYNAIPMEDFNYRPEIGFNRRGWGNGGEYVKLTHYTDESVLSSGSGMGPGGFAFWTGTSGLVSNVTGNNIFAVSAYGRNRDVSIFMKSIAEAKEGGVITEDTYNRLKSEAHFTRAYIYFQLAKRYGGVCLIDWLQDDDYNGDATPLFISRSTEEDTWKFVLKECDKAIEYLPTPENFKDGDGDSRYRATKWAGYALKSRAALYAASLAKYGGRATFSGEAVNQKLVGMDASLADFFYSECISASKAIIDNSTHSLYKPNPANGEEAAKNYQEMFMNALGDEIIFARSYIDGTKLENQGHDYDIFFSPSQASTGFHKWGRFSPSLDMVDLYEDYTDDGTGKSAQIVTRTDGKENEYLSTNSPLDAQITSIPFVKYDNPYEPFKNKDARLHGSIIVPGAEYKGITIVMQGGLITKNGEVKLYQSYSEEGKDGKMYYSYGAESPSGYSGFASMTSGDDANYSSTGFTIRKFLAEDKTITGAERSSNTPWIDFRLGEVYLNYAEAVAESGSGDRTAAAGYINALRKRAGHTDQIPLTLDNVLKERRVELAFEGQRLWDMFRRREYHTLFNNHRRHALVQLVDLREDTPKYVFVRMEQFHDIQAGGRTFQTMNYYFNIPGTDVNGLVNNPGR